jgi:hypothetical protein
MTNDAVNNKEKDTVPLRRDAYITKKDDHNLPTKDAASNSKARRKIKAKPVICS